MSVAVAAGKETASKIMLGDPFPPPLLVTCLAPVCSASLRLGSHSREKDV